MAKKARRKLEEEEAAAFEFPVFDELGFIKKEFELGAGVVFAGIFAALAGILGWALVVLGVPWWAPFLLGILLIAATPTVIRRVRPSTYLYTRGDWAGLLALVFFGWLAVWFVLLDLAPNAL